MAATSGPHIAGFVVVLVGVLFRTGAAGDQQDGPILWPTGVEQSDAAGRVGSEEGFLGGPPPPGGGEVGEPLLVLGRGPFMY